MKITIVGALTVIAVVVLLALIADRVVKDLSGEKGNSDENPNNPA